MRVAFRFSDPELAGRTAALGPVWVQLMPSTDLIRVKVPLERDGARLDACLAAEAPGLTRSRIKTLILEGCVSRTVAPSEPAHGVRGGETISDPAYRVKHGQIFAIQLPDIVSAEPVGQSIPLDIVYEDDALIVIDKPAGLVVHPAAGNPDNTLVNALIAHCGESLSGIGGVARPGIVHRLDKDTSGLMVAAKTDKAHLGLAEQFAAHSIDRAYKAVILGVPNKEAGRIEGNIGRSPTNRKKMAVVARAGKPAVTRYRLLKAFGTAASLVECRLETGRTHQIRVHMTHIGHPLIGDPLYGRARKLAGGVSAETVAAVAGFPRQALHAFRLGFRHPNGQEKLMFESHMPNDLNELVISLEMI